MTAYSLDHLALAVREWRQAGPILAGRFGGQWQFGVRQPRFSPAQLLFANDMRLELLEPGTDPTSFVRRFLDEGPGQARPHHITFKVSDIHAALAATIDAGFEPILANLEWDSWKEFFIHPQATGLGFLIQVVEAPRAIADIIGAGGGPVAERPWSVPSTRPAAIPFIYGRVGDLDLCRRLLSGVLGAAETSGPDGAVCFRWPSGADLILAQDTDEPALGIHTIGFRPDGSSDWAPPGHMAAGRLAPEIGARVAVVGDTAPARGVAGQVAACLRPAAPDGASRP